MGPEPRRVVARVLAVGSELLGDKADLNGPDLARRLKARGAVVAGLQQVPDDRAVLAREIAAALATADLVILLGGLGPTDDDLTREALADATGCGIAEDPDARRRIEAFHAERGRVPSELSLRQALVPAGAEAVANRTGLAAGAVLALERHVVVLLPGPPGELAAMVDEALERAERRLAERGLAFGPPLAQAVLVLAGLGESDAAARVRGLEALAGLDVAWLARPGEVRLLLRHESPERVASARAAARAALGRDVVSDEGRGLAEVVLAALAEREESLALAESCTGGLVAAELTSVPGSSAVVRAGFVTYANDAKVALGVPPALLAQHGAVSAEVARAMAHAARQAGQADWGVGITGIAGPGGATETKPVGLVHWAVARPDGRIEERQAVFGGSRDDVRRRAAAAALDSVRRLL